MAKEMMRMSNSSLVKHTNISPNSTNPRNHKIDTITIHCVVGQLSVETIGHIFKPKSRQASSNYGIGSDGRIGMYVEEKNRSWCSSSASNDNRAITIEVASDTKHPYAVNDKAYSSLITLITDICKRNDIKELKWRGDKSLIGKVDSQNMTVHRWFKNKECPGEYLYSRHGAIAAEVNKRLGVSGSTKGRLVRVNINNLNIRSGPGTNYKRVGQTGQGIFTIVETSGSWGKLKSGAGWIALKYTSDVDTSKIELGDIVDFKGGKYYVSADGGAYKTSKPGKARVTQIVRKGKHPYHLMRVGSGATVYGWVASDSVSK